MPTKRLGLSLGSAAVVALCATVALAQTPSAGQVLIGTRTIGANDNTDNINIPAAFGNLASLSLILKAQNPSLPVGPLYVTTLKITYQSGDPQEVAINAMIPIDPAAPLVIPTVSAGADNVITRLDFAYDHAQDGGTATYLWVWGERN